MTRGGKGAGKRTLTDLIGHDGAPPTRPPPSTPRNRTAWEWFVFFLGILGQVLYDIILLASPDTTRRQRRYGSLMHDGHDSDGEFRSRKRGGARSAVRIREVATAQLAARRRLTFAGAG